MRTLLDAGPDALHDLAEEAKHKIAAGRDLIDNHIALGPPVPDPDKILCVGFNYRAHSEEMQVETTDVPNIFAKFRNSLVGPTDRIVLPSNSSEVDYEGELAVIIGARCRSVDSTTALKYVAGYTIANDVSARDLQFASSQWTMGKAADTFCPLGPALVTADEVGDPQKLALTTRLNGQVVQDASTSMMEHGVADIIAYLSSCITLEPGDVIATGTPAGVGWKRRPPLFLASGDMIEVEIQGLGTIRNLVA